ncbi:unnamed protein product [Anisakis simplex]|uniref:RAP domain-containing protein n=1 Tax=Anisakis simplex TaxID=6269 RepID=A0A0M3JSW0_ANISI|nr:unnamed protein product [Anisakis simplex]
MNSDLRSVERLVGFNQQTLSNVTDCVEHFCKIVQLRNCRSNEHNKAWICITKCIYESDDGTLKAIEPLLQRGISSAKSFMINIEVLHFLRAALYRLPSLGRFNHKTLLALIPNMIDFATKHYDVAINRLLVCDILSVLWREENELQLLKELCTNTSTDNTRLNISMPTEIVLSNSLRICVKHASAYLHLIALTFQVHMRRIHYNANGMSLSLDVWLESAIKVIQLNHIVHDAVLSWLHTVIVHAQHSVQPFYRTILSLIEYAHPSHQYYKFITAFITHLHFAPDMLLSCINRSIRYPLCLQTYGQHYANAMCSLLLKRSVLLKQQFIDQLRLTTLDELKRFPDSLPALRICNALLISYPSDTLFQVANSNSSVFESMQERVWCDALSGTVIRLENETTFYLTAKCNIHSNTTARTSDSVQSSNRSTNIPQNSHETSSSHPSNISPSAIQCSDETSSKALPLPQPAGDTVASRSFPLERSTLPINGSSTSVSTAVNKSSSHSNKRGITDQNYNNSVTFPSDNQHPPKRLVKSPNEHQTSINPSSLDTSQTLNDILAVFQA